MPLATLVNDLPGTSGAVVLPVPGRSFTTFMEVHSRVRMVINFRI